ncbi:RAD55 family ATPase [Candidatus Altiarchaeota archaeon]
MNEKVSKVTLEVTGVSKRLPTGVNGLDEIIEGGVPVGDSMLIAGATGTGKTILGLQIASTHAKNGGKALYLTFEENKERLIRHMDNLGFPGRELIEEGKLVIKAIENDSDINDINEYIKNLVTELNVDLILIDSITMLFTLSRYFTQANKRIREVIPDNIRPMGDILNREDIFCFIHAITKLPVTSIFIDEACEQGHNITRNGVAEYIVDAVILLNLQFGPKFMRTLLIRKMRDTNHSEEYHPILIERGNGIRLIDIE